MLSIEELLKHTEHHIFNRKFFFDFLSAAYTKELRGVTGNTPKAKQIASKG